MTGTITLLNSRTSTYTLNAPVQNCVRLGEVPGAVAVQDTKEDWMGDAHTTIVLSPGAWTRFIGAI